MAQQKLFQCSLCKRKVSSEEELTVCYERDRNSSDPDFNLCLGVYEEVKENWDWIR
jgi:hypothetical protein